jgi:hypothetical protein
MLFNNNQQKSPQRRFLLILGAIVFLCIFGWGLFIIFDANLFPNLPKTQKTLIGLLIIVYAVLRFSRLIKKKPDEI